MKKFFGNSRVVAVCMLCLLVGLAGVLVFQTYATLTPEERAKKRYAELMAQEAQSIDDLTDLWAEEA